VPAWRQSSQRGLSAPIVQPVSAFQIAPNGAHEGLHPHWFCKHEALDQVEAELARCDEIGLVLDTDCHCAGAELIGCGDDMAAKRPLGAILRTTGDQFRLDLDFDERKVAQLQERAPLAAEAINRNGELA